MCFFESNLASQVLLTHHVLIMSYAWTLPFSTSKRKTKLCLVAQAPHMQHASCTLVRITGAFLIRPHWPFPFCSDNDDIVNEPVSIMVSITYNFFNLCLI